MHKNQPNIRICFPKNKKKMLGLLSLDKKSLQQFKLYCSPKSSCTFSQKSFSFFNSDVESSVNIFDVICALYKTGLTILALKLLQYFECLLICFSNTGHFYNLRRTRDISRDIICRGTFGQNAGLSRETRDVWSL